MSNKKSNLIITILVCATIAAAAIFAVFAVKNSKSTDTGDTESTGFSETVTSMPDASGTGSSEEAVSSEPETSSEIESSKAESSEDTVSVEDYTATMYTTSKDLNVRSAPNSNNEPLGTLALGSAVSVTGKCANGWYRINYNGKVAYCYGKFLSTEKKEESSESPSSTASTPAKGNTPYFIKVNRSQNIVIIYKKDENGEYTVPFKAMVCSVGRAGHLTPTGAYKLSDKYRWACLSGGVWGQYVTRFKGPYLFHSVPYFSKNNSKLEYDEYNKLGQPASKGCVRLSVSDAKWIYDNCAKGTGVSVYDSAEAEPLAKPTPIKIDTSDSRKGWDPTDPDPKNPWKK